MTPTPEQAAIVEAAARTSDNIMVNALAGAAKTTTLELICRRITGIPILSLAFNKRIADEMAKRLPSHVSCKTMNALGHGVWSQVVGQRLRVSTDKSHSIVKSLIAERAKRDQGELYDSMSDVLRVLRMAKREGYVPARWPAKRLIADADFFGAAEDELGYDLPVNIVELCNEALSASIQAAYAGVIDFDDQLYMPTLFGGAWPRFPLVLIDEFQDLNVLQQEMLAALVTKRLIGVGDPWQSIYGFRGALTNGMAAAVERWNMKEFGLSVTFRVPRAGVERAHFRVPHMQPRPDAPEGRVEALTEWSADTIPDGAAILCRNNAPLFSMGLRLLAAGRGVKLVGMDIGPGLLRILKKLGEPSMPVAALAQAINTWETQGIRKARRAETVSDRAACLRVFAAGRTLAEAILYAEHLFASSGPIQLLSGHKAKGLEWNTVFHLDPWRIPSRYAFEAGGEALEQEWNVRYVIETRFKEELYLVDLEGFQ